MAKLPLIVTIVALLCAAGLGIAAKKKADQKVRELATAQTELKGTQSALTTKTAELGKANESLVASEKEVEAKTAEVAKLNGDVKAGQDKLAAADARTEKAADTLARQETELVETKAKWVEEMTARTALETKLAEAQKEIEEKRLAIETLKNRKPVAENTDAPSRPAAPSGPPPNLTGSVLAVNEGLNFLVLSVGDRQGVNVNTSMLVVRGGQRVATLKVTSIEPRTSIAEVVPGTMARGQAVQRGDQVVLIRSDRKAGSLVPPKGARSVPSRSDVEPALPEA
jgi:hypothetical protein